MDDCEEKKLGENFLKSYPQAHRLFFFCSQSYPQGLAIDCLHNEKAIAYKVEYRRNVPSSRRGCGEFSI